METFLQGHLGRSHIFCAYRKISGFHAVLIYRIGRGNVNSMDPDPGLYRVRPMPHMEVRGPFLVMWHGAP